MPEHVVVDGSNLATEGRQMPSLRQLKDAVAAFVEERPDSLITIVVDATFGHRIDPSELAEFDDDVNNNRIVAPPAGAVGRGDAFVLSIAKKVKATILTNDSYQEFHHEAPWLFEEGRLIGGKPVPHIGWVFVNRIPVRGPKSRKATADAKRKRHSEAASDTGPGSSTVRVGSADASQPMPVPKAPPPGQARKASKKAKAPVQAEAKTVADDAHKPAAAPRMEAAQVNDLMAFLSFVEQHPVGSLVQAVVDHYASHGAYVKVGEVLCYLPLRLMASPAPRSAREFVKLGEPLELVVQALLPARRSIDLAVPAMAGATVAEDAPAKKAAGKKAAGKKLPAKNLPEKKVAAKKAVESAKKAPTKVAPVKKVAAKKLPAEKAPTKVAPVKKVAAKKVAAKKVAAKKAPAKKASAKKAPAKKATA